MIKIICIGKIKEKFFRDAVDEYLKRLSKYTSIKIIELKEETIVEDKVSITKESKYLLDNIKENEFNILLDVDSESLSSIELSNFIEKTLIKNSNINFIIGGSNGVNQELKDKVDFKLSFSKLTFPHQLFRIILLEQIYRSFKIINNEKYHK